MDSEYEELWTAVLKQSIEDLQDDNLKIKLSANSWFYRDDFDVGSFRWVCKSLGVNHNSVRKRIFFQKNT